MTGWKIALIVAASPAVAFAQLQAADAARSARAAQQARDARVGAAIDSSLREPPSQAPGDAPARPQDPAGDARDLNRAAARIEGAPVPGGEGGGGAPDVYTIQRGDTLWDLSARFLESPWYWPKLWSYNPQIENPHWIYPGNLVRFGPGGAGAPVRAEPVQGTDLVEAPRELEDLSRGDIDRSGLDDGDAVAVVGPYRIGRNRASGLAVMRNSFVTAARLEESARIVAAPEEKIHLATGDRFYARFPASAQPTVGQAFSIFRVEEKLHHPRGGFVGWKTVILGSARVTANDPSTAATLVITYVNDGVQRGDLLGPPGETTRKPLFVRPNQSELEGYIIGVEPSIVTGAAEYSVVYLDRGQADGVEVGNTFEVVRAGDPYGQPVDRVVNDRRLPTEVIGDVVVFDAQDRAASAYVRRSVLELLVGDRVRMRPTAAAAPGPSRGG